MELKPGYKLTDVGIFPTEWCVSPITEVTTAIFLGLTSTVDYVNSGGIPLIRATDIANGHLSFAVARTISLRQHRELTKYRRAKRGNVLVSKSGSLGVCAIVDVDVEFSIYESIIVLQPNHRLDSLFLLSLMRDEATQSRMIGEKVGSSVAHLNLEMFRKLIVPVPPVAEQRAIAGALSDVDALIGALDQLLAKKRDLKQAAMQQLLTGHQRLPGFAPANPRFQQTDLGRYPSDWNLKPLAQLVDESRSIRYGIVQPGKYDPRGRLMIRGQDYSKGWVEPTEMFRVSDPIEERYRNARVQTGDLIITIVGAGTGTVQTIPNWLDGANLTQTTARIAINDHEADSEFCKHILQTKVGTGQVANFIKGGAQPGLNCGDIKKFDIPMPPTVAEQTAIAEVLSDMDAELAALEQKRDKTRLLKQGMMQELLTGRTRLI